MTVQATGSLDAVLAGLLNEPVADVRVERSRYSTSFPIDNITVELATGVCLELIRKDLDWAALLPEARHAKPHFLYDPRREMSAYTDLLADGPAGPARCYGTVDEPDAGRRWLFLERLDGVELFQVGDIGRWAACARWIAEFHRSFNGLEDQFGSQVTALHTHDRLWLQLWADRALAASTRVTIRSLHFLHSRIDALADRFMALERTLTHGEFYASNVIVSNTSAPTRVSPIDWEMIALAPGLIDLAALTSGRLDPGLRVEIEYAYCEAAGRRMNRAFCEELDICRLTLCLQWLGWMPDWQPPPEHAHDWLSEALNLADRLGL